jgi:hypothetical protein
MKQTLITTVLALGLGLLSTPSFASGYVVNGHAASPAEAQHLVAGGIQQGAWVVNGYGIALHNQCSSTAGLVCLATILHLRQTESVLRHVEVLHASHARCCDLSGHPRGRIRGDS